jgi:hypothetical protein
MVVNAQAYLWMNTAHGEACRLSKNAVTDGKFTSLGSMLLSILVPGDNDCSPG